MDILTRMRHCFRFGAPRLESENHMNIHANVVRLITLGSFAAWLSCGGCAAPPEGPVAEVPREMSGATGQCS
jgi:hypothetical protein